MIIFVHHIHIYVLLFTFIEGPGFSQGQGSRTRASSVNFPPLVGQPSMFGAHRGERVLDTILGPLSYTGSLGMDHLCYVTFTVILLGHRSLNYLHDHHGWTNVCIKTKISAYYKVCVTYHGILSGEYHLIM